MCGLACFYFFIILMKKTAIVRILRFLSYGMCGVFRAGTQVAKGGRL